MSFKLSTMPSYFPIFLVLGAVCNVVTADNIYSYLQPGCTGSAFFFKDIDHNVCALSITGNATSIKDAIDKGLTTVRSGKLEVQETGKKHFIGWDEGPDSNADGLLQCGHISVNQAVSECDTCISGEFHGLSWTEPGDNRRKRSVYTCTDSKEPDAVLLNDGKHYRIAGISESDAKRLKHLAYENSGNVPADLSKYEFKPAV